MSGLFDPLTTDAVTIDAPADVVWAIYSDIARWPEWTRSVTSAVLEPDGPLGPASRASIKQPRLPRVTWTVTWFEPGRSWVWENRSPGATSIAAHRLSGPPEGPTHVQLSIEQRGVVGRVVGLLYRGLTRKYLRLEAEGLRRRSEATTT